ncbi:hypothetical protein [Streptomyces sp. NPDC056401]|uniref:hypothetical protein n=1 Tax=Streptomyces sp. NPDC056401 TaxID=3345809 RepID=UPI0035E371F0
MQYQGGPDAEQAAGWRRFVDAAQRVDFLDLTAPGLRAVAATMAELMEHQLTAVERAGAGALRKDVGYGFTAPLRTLVRARARRPRTAT